MNRINQLFSQKKANILSIYFCAGHPSFDNTVPTIQALEAHGIDMIEIGIPFSDPMADGPVIQQAATQALREGMTLRKLFAQLEGIREKASLPLILMGYLNPIMQFGFEAFCQRCRETGIDALAPSFGTAHGLYKSKPVLDLERVKTIAEKTALPLVMHGGSGVSPEDYRIAIRNVIRKINYYSYMSNAGVRAVKALLEAENVTFFHDLAFAAQQAMEENAADAMRVFAGR